jgi:hypothetical protein
MKKDKYNPNNPNTLSSEQVEVLLGTLQARFENNMKRHAGLDWAEIQTKLGAAPQKLWSLNEMERPGGEPDVVDYDEKTGEFVFFDCSKESPEGRRSLCYDQKALEERIKFKPEGSAMAMAAEMGIEMLDERQYRDLQKLGEFDTATSSWLKTPEKIRRLGGAMFADRRYDTVWTYHNGAESYYAARGFRASLRV